jgi:hypothetical protein
MTSWRVIVIAMRDGKPAGDASRPTHGRHDLFALDYNDSLLFVVIRQHNLYDLAGGCLQVLAYILSLNRQFAMSPVDQHRELDAPGPAEINELVQRRANGSACVEHVIDKHYSAVGDIGGYIGAIDDRTRSDCREIIAIKRDVELAGWRTRTFELGDLLGDSFGERDAASPDADEKQVGGTAIALDYLRGETRERAADVLRVHNLRLEFEFHPRNAL